MSIIARMSFCSFPCADLGSLIECSFYRPTIFRNSFTYSTIRQIKFITPLAHGHGFAFITDYLIASSIIRLLFLNAPYYIARLIISIVIYTLYAMFFARPFANIIKERLKGLIPWFMKFNPSAAISFIWLRFWVIATGFYCFPCLIFSRIALTMKRRSSNLLYISHVFNCLVTIKILKASFV
jgi:hypothetical protein